MEEEKVEKVKVEYDYTAIYYIKMLKTQQLIETWNEGAQIYYQLTKQEITAQRLSSKVKNLVFKDEKVNPVSLEKYLERTPEFVNTTIEMDEDDKTIEKTKLSDDSSIVKVLGIKEEDYESVFGIDIENDSNDTIVNKLNQKIGDENFLLQYLGYNPGVFEISKIDRGAWSVVLKIEKSRGHVKTMHPRKIMNDRFAVTIKKREKPFVYVTKEEWEKFLEDFLKERNITPFDIFDNNYKNQNANVYNDNLLMVSPGLELHLGKLSSVIDYEDYSVKQAMWRLRQTAFEIVKYQKYAKCANLLLGVGNDFFNSDTMDDKTTAGTPQNNDTRPKEVYLWGKIGYMQLIETLKHEFKKTILKGMPGNHDERSSFCLYTNLYDIYSMMNDPKVDVELSYEALRYTTCHTFGKNLIVFTHGKNPESKNLSDNILAEAVKSQFPEEYHRAHNIYVFAGHIHQDSETKIGNVTVIRTASLSGVDSWHAANNFLGQREGHSVYLFDKEKGYIGKHNITIGEDDIQKKVSGASRKPKAKVDDEMRKTLNLTNPQMNIELQKQNLDNVKTSEDEIENTIDRVVRLVKKDNLDDEELKNKVLEILGWDKDLRKLEKHRQMILKLLK